MCFLKSASVDVCGHPTVSWNACWTARQLKYDAGQIFRCWQRYFSRFDKAYYGKDQLHCDDGVLCRELRKNPSDRKHSCTNDECVRGDSSQHADDMWVVSFEKWWSVRELARIGPRHLRLMGHYVWKGHPTAMLHCVDPTRSQKEHLEWSFIEIPIVKFSNRSHVICEPVASATNNQEQRSQISEVHRKMGRDNFEWAEVPLRVLPITVRWQDHCQELSNSAHDHYGLSPIVLEFRGKTGRARSPARPQQGSHSSQFGPPMARSSSQEPSRGRLVAPPLTSHSRSTPGDHDQYNHAPRYPQHAPPRPMPSQSPKKALPPLPDERTSHALGQSEFLPESHHNYSPSANQAYQLPNAGSSASYSQPHTSNHSGYIQYNPMAPVHQVPQSHVRQGSSSPTKRPLPLPTGYIPSVNQQYNQYRLEDHSQLSNIPLQPPVPTHQWLHGQPSNPATVMRQPADWQAWQSSAPTQGGRSPTKQIASSLPSIPYTYQQPSSPGATVDPSYQLLPGSRAVPLHSHTASGFVGYPPDAMNLPSASHASHSAPQPPRDQQRLPPGRTGPHSVPTPTRAIDSHPGPSHHSDHRRHHSSRSGTQPPRGNY